ncbi:Iron-sulfur assembly protein 1 [Myotisia sp. PD_48]|nr:Iron-sulfur assembly protein 1 [Myotisia sp. PD_48]
MSFCRTPQIPVTSSPLKALLRLKPCQQCSQSLRTFSSFYPSHSSSKRELQTATAYRPYTLPDSFPPPRNVGTPSTSISNAIPAFNPLQSYTFPETGELSKPNDTSSSSSYCLPEAEAQKSKSISNVSSQSTTTTPTTKPRKSKLKARKAAVKLTPAALNQLKHLLSQPDPKMIRIGVKNRGCSGLAYHLEYVDKPASFDEVVEQDGVKVLIDSKALFSIIGSEMDWQEDKLSSRFVFNNPNIKDECGCGESFMV